MLSSLVKRPFLLSSHTDSHPKTQLQAAPLNPQAGPKWLPWEPIPRFTRLCPHATLWYWNQLRSSLLEFMSVLPTPKIFPGQVFSKCSPELNNWMKFPSWALWFNFFHLGGQGWWWGKGLLFTDIPTWFQVMGLPSLDSWEPLSAMLLWTARSPVVQPLAFSQVQTQGNARAWQTCLILYLTCTKQNYDRPFIHRLIFLPNFHVTLQKSPISVNVTINVVNFF